MNNKQILVYVALESKNDSRSIFVGRIHFKKLMKFRKFIEIFHCCMKEMGRRNFKKSFEILQFQGNILLWHDQTQEHDFGCFYTMSIHKNRFKK